MDAWQSQAEEDAKAAALTIVNGLAIVAEGVVTDDNTSERDKEETVTR